jgi:hypothetical protein
VFDICHTIAPPSIGSAGASRVECHLFGEG